MICHKHFGHDCLIFMQYLCRGKSEQFSLVPTIDLDIKRSLSV